MKKLYTLLILYILASVSTLSVATGQDTYGRVLYRVNAGGWHIASIDTSNQSWIQDDSYGACPYVDTNIVGDKTFGVHDPITLDASVPASTPNNIFKTERDLSKAGQDRLQYNFPIDAGQKVEVRLYFSENYYNVVGDRLMDVFVEEVNKISNFDIFAEVGKNVGLMKKYVVTVNDGNLDIDIKKIKNYAMINGIEIVEISDATVQGIFSSNAKPAMISVFPNPFSNEIKVDNAKFNIESINIYDAYGKEIPISYDNSLANITLGIEANIKGIYFLKIVNHNNEIETVRLMKE